MPSLRVANPKAVLPANRDRQAGVWHGLYDALQHPRYWTPQAWYEQVAPGEWGLDGEGSDEDDDDELEGWSEDEDDEEEEDDEEDDGPLRHSPGTGGSGAVGAGYPGRAAERPHARRPQGQQQQPACGLGVLAPVREEAAEALLSSSPSGGPGGSGGTGSGGKGRDGVANRGLARLVRQPYDDSDSGTTTTTTGTGTYVGPSEASGLERTGTADTQGSDSIFGLWGKPGARGDRDQEEEEEDDEEETTQEMTVSTGMTTTATTSVTNTTGTEATGVTGNTGGTGTEVGVRRVVLFGVLWCYGASVPWTAAAEHSGCHDIYSRRQRLRFNECSFTMRAGALQTARRRRRQRRTRDRGSAGGAPTQMLYIQVRVSSCMCAIPCEAIHHAMRRFEEGCLNQCSSHGAVHPAFTPYR